MSRAALVIPLLLLCQSSYSQFRLNDTLFFLRELRPEGVHQIFVDTNPSSWFYTRVASFKLQGFHLDSYKESLDYLRAKRLHLIKHAYADLPLAWTELQTYKGKQYVNAPADFYFHYKMKLTDSVLMDWGGEGPEAQYIHSFRKLDASTYQFVLSSASCTRRELTIRIVDKAKGIAIFRDDRTFAWEKKARSTIYYPMVDIRKMRLTPLLVNYCDYQKHGELDFDQVDYCAMFGTLGKQ